MFACVFVCLAACLYVCVSVYPRTKNNGSISLKLEDIVVYEINLEEFD